MLNYGALKDASKHWMIASNKTCLFRDTQIYWLHKLNPQLIHGKPQSRVPAQETLTKVQCEVAAASFFINFGFIKLKLMPHLDCARVSEQGQGALESFIILTGADTSGVHQATSFTASSLGEQLCVNSQLCVIPYGSNTPSSSLNI